MKKTKERGSLTVEVVLILVPFMLCFMTMLNISRVVEAEVIVHHAITQTAKEISTYSYVLTKSKISSQMISTNGKSAQFQGDVSKVVNSFTEFGTTLGNMGSSGNVFDQIDTMSNDVTTIQDTAQSYIEDPSSIGTGILAVLKSGARAYGMRLIAGQLAKSSIKKQLGLVTEDPDTYLEYIGIEGGLDGLDFSKTEWLNDTSGKGTIKVVVTFKMKNTLFPMFDFGEHEMCLCAQTALW